MERFRVGVDDSGREAFPRARAGVVVVRGVSNFGGTKKQRRIADAARLKSSSAGDRREVELRRATRVDLACQVAGLETGCLALAWNVNTVGGAITIGDQRRSSDDCSGPSFVNAAGDDLARPEAGGGHRGRVSRATTNVAVLAVDLEGTQAHLCSARVADLIKDWCGGDVAQTVSLPFRTWEGQLEL
ncbi:hypothetical protein [Paraconexibacter sp. AEG42_29]|uniref:hypothetical protein n=1 Tax=Paraconexibacter sp. AEG42_29 TaxID=2997339 RepID=UPI00339D4DB1